MFGYADYTTTGGTKREFGSISDADFEFGREYTINYITWDNAADKFAFEFDGCLEPSAIQSVGIGGVPGRGNSTMNIGNYYGISIRHSDSHCRNPQNSDSSQRIEISRPGSTTFPNLMAAGAQPTITFNLR